VTCLQRGVVALAVTGRLATGGPGITRARAQQLARRELARSIYRPSLLARWWQDIKVWLASLVGTSAGGSPSWWGLTLLAIVLLAVVAAVVFWLGPTSIGRPYRDRAVLGEGKQSAADYRAAAERLAAAGNYRDAVAERMRAIAAELEEREILPPRPSRTAAELAAEAGLAIPAERRALEASAVLFDRVRYGGRAAREADYAHLGELDSRIRAAWPDGPHGLALAHAAPPRDGEPAGRGR
jgi:hypothetical protein